MSITDYKLIEADSAEALTAAVAEAMGDGYQPFGQPVSRVRAEFNSWTYAQAVIKGTPDSGGGSGGTVTVDNITDATATGKAVLKSADATAARTAIGAGTSSLAIGTTGTTAAAGNRAAAAGTTGMVLKGAAVADSAATDVAGVNTVLNALLASLRAAGSIS